MFDNATLSQLHEMRLPAMARCFTEQQSQTGIHSLSFEERFALLVEAEWLDKCSSIPHFCSSVSAFGVQVNRNTHLFSIMPI